MILTTTPTVEGCPIRQYCGIVCGEVLFQPNFMKNAVGNFATMFGGRSLAHEDELITAREESLSELSERAAARGANAVVGVDINYEVLNTGMIMVITEGTAVICENLH